MPLLKSSTDILSQIEPAAGLNVQNLAGYSVNSVALRAPTATSGYYYSGETFAPTGYKKAGQQLVFPRIGCRPGRRQSQRRREQCAVADFHRELSLGRKLSARRRDEQRH
jgi:hypothetical protein